MRPPEGLQAADVVVRGEDERDLPDGVALDAQLADALAALLAEAARIARPHPRHHKPPSTSPRGSLFARGGDDALGGSRVHLRRWRCLALRHCPPGAIISGIGHPSWPLGACSPGQSGWRPGTSVAARRLRQGAVATWPQVTESTQH